MWLIAIVGQDMKVFRMWRHIIIIIYLHVAKTVLSTIEYFAHFWKTLFYQIRIILCVQEGLQLQFIVEKVPYFQPQKVNHQPLLLACMFLFCIPTIDSVICWGDGIWIQYDNYDGARDYINTTAYCTINNLGGYKKNRKLTKVFQLLHGCKSLNSLLFFSSL